jgi:hypothetical protein
VSICFFRRLYITFNFNERRNRVTLVIKIKNLGGEFVHQKEITKVKKRKTRRFEF